MHLKLYRDYLSMGKELLNQAKLPFKVKKAQKSLELEIAKLESEVADKESAVQDQITRSEVEWNKVIDALDEKALKERKLKQLNDLNIQLFNNK